MLAAQRIPIQWIHPYRGDSFPQASRIRGMISLGGPMSSNDELDHPWIRHEIQLLQDCLEADVPILGICLGGQLLARALGKRVYANPRAEVGWHPLELTPEGRGDPIFSAAAERPTVYHYHFETFEVPQGATLLARSSACERQAYRLNAHTYGLQFHPEADHQLLAEWMSFDDFDEEIEQIRAQHGDEFVQDSRTQLLLATEAELNSIPLITAFSTLFRQERHSTSSRGAVSTDGITMWHQLKVPVEVEITSTDGAPFAIRGLIERLLNISDENFIVIRGEDHLVWPIRIADIRQIRPVSK